ncbi:MAG: hypothetical protein BAJALOKI2v1_400035 [Promethearchaeota archaeon]|nr:MAG: hypothetical protein BAJALOKI2v1_400035 [Candidatus Lokiarchaeota archaeon]
MEVDALVTTNNFRRHRFRYLNIVILWLSLFSTVANILSFMEFFYKFFPPVVLLIILPWAGLFFFLEFLIFLLFFAKMFLIFANILKKPKEGIFEKSIWDQDYMFYCYRKSIKELVLKLFNYFPLPWVKILVLKVFNIKIPSNSGVLDSYIDSDFIKFGNEVILGEGSVVMSSMIIRDTLIVKEVILKDGCTVGVNSVIAPGTIMEKKSILGMGSYTKINQHLEEGWIYVGKPAIKHSKV